MGADGVELSTTLVLFAVGPSIVLGEVPVAAGELAEGSRLRSGLSIPPVVVAVP